MRPLQILIRERRIELERLRVEYEAAQKEENEQKEYLQKFLSPTWSKSLSDHSLHGNDFVTSFARKWGLAPLLFLFPATLTISFSFLYALLGTLASEWSRSYIPTLLFHNHI